jgi:hypothetical protein
MSGLLDLLDRPRLTLPADTYIAICCFVIGIVEATDRRQDKLFGLWLADRHPEAGTSSLVWTARVAFVAFPELVASADPMNSMTKEQNRDSIRLLVTLWREFVRDHPSALTTLL